MIAPLLKVPGGFLITPSGIAYNTMLPDQIVFIDDEGKFEVQLDAHCLHDDLYSTRTCYAMVVTCMMTYTAHARAMLWM